MPEIKTTTASVNWTSAQAFAVALICLLLGLAGGWSIHKFIVAARVADSVAPSTPPTGTPPAAPSGALATMPSPEQLRKIADTQAAPLLELESRSQQCRTAHSPRQHLLRHQAVSDGHRLLRAFVEAAAGQRRVRTDLGTAYWYMGNADAALAEFNKALTYSQTRPTPCSIWDCEVAEAKTIPMARLQTGKSCWTPTRTTPLATRCSS